MTYKEQNLIFGVTLPRGMLNLLGVGNIQLPSTRLITLQPFT